MFLYFRKPEHNSVICVKSRQKNDSRVTFVKGTTVLKSIMTVFLLCCFPVFYVSAQDCSELENDSEMRQELQSLANSAASDLMKCCSKWGGNNLKATIIWDKDEDGVCQTRISKLTKTVTITMKVSWEGSISGASYWIKGRLLVNLETGRRKWEKISDSGGFQTGCSNGCIN